MVIKIIKKIMLILVFFIFLPYVYGLNKPIQGFSEEKEDMSNAIVIVNVEVFSNKIYAFNCSTYPVVYPDKKGYYITNLGNLKKNIDGSDCSGYWNKGDKIWAVASSYLMKNPGKDMATDVSFITSKSGAPITLPKLKSVDYKIKIPSFEKKALLKIEKASIIKEKNIYKAEVTIKNTADSFLNGITVSWIIMDAGLRNIKTISIDNINITAKQKKDVELIWNTVKVYPGIYSGDINLYLNNKLIDTYRHEKLVVKRAGMLSHYSLVLISILILAILILLLLLFFRKKGKERNKKKN